MTPFEARWCTDRVLDGTLEVDGDRLTVTDAGWDFILRYGAIGTDLEGVELDRAFVLGAAHGAGEVACLYNAVGAFEAALAAVGIGFVPQERPHASVVVVDHNADPEADTPLQAAVRKMMEEGE